MTDLVVENERLRRANMALQRRLEKARRDALLYAAIVCEDHVVSSEGLRLVRKGDPVQEGHAGQVYAKKLREIAK